MVKRAVVLGGGGSVGNAWEVGVIAGLFDSGLDVTAADLIIGTSAGATAAAQVSAGTSASAIYAATASAAPPLRRGPGAGHRPSGPPVNLIQVTDAIIAAAADAADLRRRMGAAALEADRSDGAGQARWRATVASRLPAHDWPQRQLVQIVAIDAATGEPVVFDRDSGVDLVDAVAASCSPGFGAAPPYRIGDRRYIDGGWRSNVNADLASGYDRVLVLPPFGARSRLPPAWGMNLDAQVEMLRAGGSGVETVLPDGPSLDAFGDDMMNLSARPAAARAGYEQGTVAAGMLSGFWN